MIEFDVDMQLVADEMDLVVLHDECCEMEPVEYVPRSEVEKLKALVRDMWYDGMCDCDEIRFCAQDEYHCAECQYHYPERMRDLGIEVS